MPGFCPQEASFPVAEGCAAAAVQPQDGQCCHSMCACCVPVTCSGLGMERGTGLAHGL